MCGIVGAFRTEGGVLRPLLEGLRVLEYRGYDSVGVGLVRDEEIVVRRKAGRIGELEGVIEAGELDDLRCGIGHSRWATHGPPTDANAHPHQDESGSLAVVHNGIIENFDSLRAELRAGGVTFRSDTDTEVLAHLIARERQAGTDVPLVEAVRRALTHVQGYYAVAVVATNGDQPAELVCSREGPPLCVAVTDQDAWLASDLLAILPHTRDIVFLEDGDVAVLRPGGLEITDRDGAPVTRTPRTIAWEAEEADKGTWPHYMLKEIHEQPDVVARTVHGRLDLEHGDVLLEGDGFQDAALQAIERIQVMACGTALHAGYVARYLIEGLARVPVDVDYASEFRYRDPVLSTGTVALGISQSGETADTLAALRLAGERGCPSIAICNSLGSTMVRESEGAILIHAGPEIGVASTKAFVAMLVAAYLFAVRLGRARGVLSAEEGRRHLEELSRVRGALETLLTRKAVEQVRALALEHQDAKGFLFLGRGINYPIALEGALKLKEISYVHAEGYPAGEMKHGPIALVEPGMTTVVVASDDHVADKVRQNIEQIRARGGQVIGMGSHQESLGAADASVEIPDVGPWLAPMLNVVPLQLFSYFVAEAKGCDIDKPRNLAKSVTVE